MNLINNVILNGFSIMLLIILCVHSRRTGEKKSPQQKLFNRVIVVTMLLLTLDILSRTDGYTFAVYPFINHLSNFVLFLLNPLLPSIWFAYVNYQIYHDKERTKRLFAPLLLLNAVNACVVVASLFNGWYYFIDSNNIYHRGPYFVVSTLITLILLFVAFIIIVLNRKEVNRKQLFSLVFFPFPPLVGAILQICFYGIAFVLNTTVLSLIIVLLSMKDDTIYTDYLTGICNRKKVEEVLKENIRKASRNRSFSLVMLDIDKFKEINDTFGHEMGDNALRALAELLNKCMRSKDYVARYGGDEFCLILEIYDNKNLEATINRINYCVNQFNNSNKFPFRLGFSMGYAVYDYTTHLKAEDYIKQVDLLMYENKRIKNDCN